MTEVLRQQNSRILQSFRAIGLVATDTPIVTYTLNRVAFVTASLGKSFVVYNCDKLTPVLVSPQVTRKIRAIAVVPQKHLTFTGCGRSILAWNRIDQTHTLSGHKGKIKQLLTVGMVLFSLDDARCLRLWDLESMELINEINFPASFTPTIMMHPSTYLNKLLIGSEEGGLELWNVRSQKQIYRFDGWKSAVTAIEQSPAVDVVGIGLRDGRIILHHLQYDKEVMTFHQSQSAVTSLSFRTDTGGGNAGGSAPIPLVVSGTSTGDIAVWNLQQKRLDSMIPSAHDGSVVSLSFLPNEPLLVSTGVDNSIKMWIFDHVTQEGTARLLKSREGHHAPPTKIRYYGNNTLATMADGADGTSCQLLSAGQDRAFRVFHTAREQQSTELSQGPILKQAKKLHVRVDDLKLPPISQFAAMETRERDWANVVTCHENEIGAYVWRFERRAIGKHVLRQFDVHDHVALGSEEDRRRRSTQASSVAMSSCGNYAIVGSVGGAVFKYNMQSGERRGSYPMSATPRPQLVRSLTLPGSSIAKEAQAKDEAIKRTSVHAHEGTVTAVAVDALNKTLVSGGIDGKLKFWNFTSHEYSGEIDLESPVSHMELHRDSNLLAIACDDQVLRVYDINTRKLARRFRGHAHRITDVTFSQDARWLFSSAADASLRVWDLPSGKCVDWLRFQKPVTGLAVSPTGEFLATTHVGHVGVFLWANKSVFTDVFLDSEPKEPLDMDLPVALNEVDNEDQLQSAGSEGNPHLSTTTIDDSNGVAEKPEETDDEYGEVEPLDNSLITLSKAPRAFWQSLFNLELIKQRNKPIEPPKAPEKAPFFLPTTRKDGVNPTFVPVEQSGATTEEEVAEPTEGWGVGDDDDTWGDDAAMEDAEEEPSSGSRISKSTGLITTRCKLAALLSEASDKPRNVPQGDLKLHRTRYHDAATYLQSLPASAVDVELSTLCMGDFDEEGKELLGHFLDCLKEEMATRRNFQVLQAYLNRFLKLHEELLVKDKKMLDQVEELWKLQQDQWQHLQQLLHNNMCLVQYFSKIQM